MFEQAETFLTPPRAMAYQDTKTPPKQQEILRSGTHPHFTMGAAGWEADATKFGYEMTEAKEFGRLCLVCSRPLQKYRSHWVSEPVVYCTRSSCRRGFHVKCATGCFVDGRAIYFPSSEQCLFCHIFCLYRNIGEPPQNQTHWHKAPCSQRVMDSLRPMIGLKFNELKKCLPSTRSLTMQRDGVCVRLGKSTPQQPAQLIMRYAKYGVFEARLEALRAIWKATGTPVVISVVPESFNAHMQRYLDLVMKVSSIQLKYNMPASIPVNVASQSLTSAPTWITTRAARDMVHVTYPVVSDEALDKSDISDVIATPVKRNRSQDMDTVVYSNAAARKDQGLLLEFPVVKPLLGEYPHARVVHQKLLERVVVFETPDWGDGDIVNQTAYGVFPVLRQLPTSPLLQPQVSNASETRDTIAYMTTHPDAESPVRWVLPIDINELESDMATTIVSDYMAEAKKWNKRSRV